MILQAGAYDFRFADAQKIQRADTGDNQQAKREQYPPKQKANETARGAAADDIESAVRAFVKKMDAGVLENTLLKLLFERITVYGDGRVNALIKPVCDAGEPLEIPLALV